VGTFGSLLYALDGASGDEIWQRPAANWVWDGPAVHEGTLYFSDVGGTVYAVEAETGQQQAWAQRPGAAMRARPAVSDQGLFAGDREGNLFRLDLAAGTTNWGAPLEGNGQILTTPLVVNDLVVVAPFGGNNRLVVYRTNGEFFWAFTPGN
jgi:outer membrane protein assembly factor BamB